MINQKDKQDYKLLLSIAVPIAIQGIISATLGLVDNLMVGFLGENELAAVGIATQIYFFHYLVLFGFNSGTATFMAQFFGANDLLNTRRATGFVTTVSLSLGVLFFILGFFFPTEVASIFTDEKLIIEMAAGYIKIGSLTFFTLAISAPLETVLKATQQTKIPLYVSTVVFTTNTCLNYLFIFGKLGLPAMGIEGAALATVIARTSEMILDLVVVFGKHNVIAGSVKEFMSWDRNLAKGIFKNAIPTVCNESLWSLGQTMYVAAFARIGVTAYAAYQAAAAIQSIFTFAGFSLGDAGLIIIGAKIGENKKEEAFEFGKKLLKAGLLFGAILGLIMIITAKPIVGLFGLTALGKGYAVKIMIIYGAFMWLGLYDGINTTGTLRGGGDTKFAAINEVLCVWLVSVPLAFAGALWWKLPIYLVVLLLKLEDIIKGIVLTKRFISKKWLNNVIKGY